MLLLPIFCAKPLSKMVSSNDIIRDNNLIIDCVTPHDSFQQATKAIPRPFAMPAAELYVPTTIIYQQQLYTSSSCMPAAAVCQHQLYTCSTSSSYIAAAAIYLQHQHQQLYTSSSYILAPYQQQLHPAAARHQQQLHTSSSYTYTSSSYIPAAAIHIPAAAIYQQQQLYMYTSSSYIPACVTQGTRSSKLLGKLVHIQTHLSLARAASCHGAVTDNSASDYS